MNENNDTAAASSENLAVLFHRAVRFMARAHHHHGHAEHAQMHVLALLEDRKSMNQRALQEMLNVRSASLSEILSKLEQRGFIERERDEEDKRNWIVTVTGQGSAAAVGDSRRKSADALFSSLSGNERQQLAELLEKVVRALEKDTSAYAGHADCEAGHAGGRLGHGHDHHDDHGGWRGHEHMHHTQGDSGTSGHGHHVPAKRGGYHDDE